MVGSWLRALFGLALLTGIVACGDTWRGLKQDTGENLQRTGQAMERVGEKVKP
jgi:hypothetical protein